MDSELSEEVEVEVEILLRFVLSPFLFAFVVGVVSELADKGMLGELMYADDLVLMS